MHNPHPSASIEILESRIAPATLSGQVVTYTDLDGDTVSIKFSTGMLAKSQFTFAGGSAFDDTVPQQLQLIDIHGITGFSGADITVTVKPAASGGDGLAAIGFINADGVDLGKVSVAGDLTRIDAGTGTGSNVAVKSLSVSSMGLYGTGSATSTIKGSIGKLTVATDLFSTVFVLADSNEGADGIGAVSIGGFISNGSAINASGTITSLKIGASLMNGSTVTAGTGIGSITIGSDLTNGSAITATTGDIGNISVRGVVNNGSGITSTAGALGNIKIGGGVFAGGHLNSAKDIGTVTVTGSVKDGGTIVSSAGKIGAVKVANMSGGGVISGAAGVASVTVGDYLLSSSVTSSGGSIGPVKIGGDISSGGTVSGVTGIGPVTIGGDLGAGGTLASTGGKIASVKIKLGVFNGGAVSGQLGVGAVNVGGDFGGSIASPAGSVGPVKITGNLTFGGISGETGVGAVTVGGGGGVNITSNSGTIGAVKVGGYLNGANILAKTGLTSLTVGGALSSTTITSNVGPVGPIKVGLDLVGSAIFGASSVKSVSVGGNVSGSGIYVGITGTPTDATIGAITVGRNWIASSVSAGVQDVSSDGYGNMDDTLIATGVSKIASILIKGAVIGTTGSTSDRYAFEAASIGSFKVNGVSVLGTANPQPLAPYTAGDVSIKLFQV